MSMRVEEDTYFFARGKLKFSVGDEGQAFIFTFISSGLGY